MPCSRVAGGIDATAVFSVTQLAIIGSRARFALTNDSGPMHVLSASGIPVFALFGPSDWRRNHALGQAARVLAAADFRAGPGNGLANIHVDDVWARLTAESLI